MGIWHFINVVLLSHLIVMAFKSTTAFSDSNAQQVVDDVDMLESYLNSFSKKDWNFRV